MSPLRTQVNATLAAIIEADAKAAIQHLGHIAFGDPKYQSDLERQKRAAEKLVEVLRSVS
jgi:hypothetical protein